MIHIDKYSYRYRENIDPLEKLHNFEKFLGIDKNIIIYYHIYTLLY